MRCSVSHKYSVYYTNIFRKKFCLKIIVLVIFCVNKSFVIEKNIACTNFHTCETHVIYMYINMNNFELMRTLKFVL